MPASRGRRQALADLARGIVVVSVSLAALPAHADVVAEVNAIRATGCDGRRATALLRRHERLEEAARLISRGAELANALPDAGYSAATSATVRVTSTGGDDSVARTLSRRFCVQLMDPELRDIGVHRSGDARWLVLAAPFVAPAVRDAGDIGRRVLGLVNEARSRPRRCGREPFAAAPPLKLVAALERAALRHAGDMAKHDFVAHTGRDGSSPGDRLKRTGYQRRLVGENVAGGPSTPEAVVRGWLASPGHCSNLMDRRFVHMGVAHAVNPRSRFRVYWAQVFAAPR